MIITLNYTVTHNRIRPEIDEFVTDIGDKNPETVLKELNSDDWDGGGTWTIVSTIPDSEVTHKFGSLGDLLEIPWYERKKRA
jgi:hypothetical protein